MPKFLISYNNGDNWQEFYPQGLAITDSKKFISVDRLSFLTNGNGTIVKSKDNCNTWKNSSTGFYNNETSVIDINGIVIKNTIADKEILNKDLNWEKVLNPLFTRYWGGVWVNNKIISYNS